MKRQVVWSECASRELERQVRYILQENKDAALKIARLVRETGQKLGDRPIGRSGRKSGTYERVLSGSSYILVFSLEARTVTILYVFHSAQDWQHIMMSDEDDSLY